MATVQNIDPDTARKLFFNGAFLIINDLPVGSEFGIDYNTWMTGEKFKGVKMIPPGVHFIYFSLHKGDQHSPRVGFFHTFKEREFVLKNWDRLTEDFSVEDASDADIDGYKSHVKELDKFLAPYPYENYKTWHSLTDHLTSVVIDKLQPLDHGRISSQSELVSKEAQDLGESSQRVDRQHPVRHRFFDRQGLPVMFLKPGTEIRFTPLDLPTQSPQAASSSKNAYDELFSRVLASCQSPSELLGELQFAFVCFLCGHLYDGFEQWKRLVRFLCSTRQSLREHEEFFEKFLTTIFFQLKLTPADFFVDIVSKSNFLVVTLAHFFNNVDSSLDATHPLFVRAEKFKKYLKKQYKWDFDSDESAECEPVYVSE